MHRGPYHQLRRELTDHARKAFVQQLVVDLPVHLLPLGRASVSPDRRWSRTLANCGRSSRTPTPASPATAKGAVRRATAAQWRLLPTWCGSSLRQVRSGCLAGHYECGSGLRTPALAVLVRLALRLPSASASALRLPSASASACCRRRRSCCQAWCAGRRRSVSYRRVSYTALQQLGNELGTARRRLLGRNVWHQRG